MHGWIYVLDDGLGHYKIGRAENLNARVAWLQIQLPVKVMVIAAFAVSDVVAAERYFHLLFGDMRLNGEWFALREPDLDTFRYCALGEGRADFLSACDDIAAGYGPFLDLIEQAKEWSARV